VCNICRVGFKLARSGSSTAFSRFGKGSYFSATSGKSHDYADFSEKTVGGTRMRLMFLCKVAVGRASAKFPDSGSIRFILLHRRHSPAFCSR
jgi:Poly(ADP-ribose) polymerase catalytic domain.